MSTLESAKMPQDNCLGSFIWEQWFSGSDLDIGPYVQVIYGQAWRQVPRS